MSLCAGADTLVVARARQALGRLDIAVTTPGVNIRKTILNYTEADLKTSRVAPTQSSAWRERVM